MLRESQREQLVLGAEKLGLCLDADTVRKFDRFAALLKEANQHLNLTRVADEEIVDLHFLDSLAIVKVPGLKLQGKIIDVGTGAGFPGLPLALALPDVQVVLLDGTRKRLAFVNHVIADLGVRNARTVHGRAEEIAGLPAHGHAYDLAIARAVAKLSSLARWLLPLVRPGGHAIAYKSREVDAEVAESRAVVERYGGALRAVAQVALPCSEIIRKFVIMEKRTGQTFAKRARRQLRES